MRMRPMPPTIGTAAVALIKPYIADDRFNYESFVAALKCYDPSPMAAQPPLSKPLKQKEALVLLGVSQPTLTRFIKNGHLKACKLPGSSLLRIDAASLQALIDGKIVNSNNESASINTTEVSK